MLLKVIGHSRGAVAAGLIAKDFYEKYSSATDIVIEVVQYDPVPGYDNFIKMNAAYAGCQFAKNISTWFNMFDAMLPALGFKDCLTQAKEIRDAYLMYYLIKMPAKIDSTVV